MTDFVILILLVLTASAALIFGGLFDHSGWAGFPARLLRKISACISRLRDLRLLAKRFRTSVKSKIGNRNSQIDIADLNCRVQTSELKENEETFDAFSVELCGSIQAPKDRCRASITLSLTDVTDESPSLVQVWMDQSRNVFGTNGPNMFAPFGKLRAGFRRRVELGRLPQKETVLSDWTAVAQIRIDTLAFARKGKRDIELEATISSAEDGEELAWTRCTFSYDNTSLGYLDLQENADRTKVLAVALAFAVSAADNELCDCEIELIEDWARDNILADSDRACEKDARRLEKVLSKTVAFFRDGNKLDTYKICNEIVELAPLAQRYDILDLCLYVARADGFVAAEELTLLKDLANWLEVDAEKFRMMMEKVLPIHMHEVKNVEAILGLTSDMSREKARRHLNREYSRWNARVTNTDPDIRSQADQMLKLIMEARGQYTAEKGLTID